MRTNHKTDSRVEGWVRHRPNEVPISPWIASRFREIQAKKGYILFLQELPWEEKEWVEMTHQMKKVVGFTRQLRSRERALGVCGKMTIRCFALRGFTGTIVREVSEKESFHSRGTIVREVQFGKEHERYLAGVQQEHEDLTTNTPVPVNLLYRSRGACLLVLRSLSYLLNVS